MFISKIVRVLPTVIKKGANKTASASPSSQKIDNEDLKNVIDYNPEELQFIITTLGEQTFKIKEIEFIYNLLVKLQEDYLQKTKKK